MFDPAEQAVLGAALLGGTGTAGVMMLTDDDWADPRHQQIAEAVRGMVIRGRIVEMGLVSQELEARGRLSKVGGASYLFELVKLAPVAASATYYAEIVRNRARLRVAKLAAERLAGTLEAEGAADDLEAVLANHQGDLRAIPESLSADEIDNPPTISDLFDLEFTHRWLVPGLIERGERIVLTAAEGTGKSVISTQFAVCLAAGLHPWTGAPIANPMRVLLIDAENSPGQTQRRYRWVGDRVDALGCQPGWGKRIVQHIRTEGLDLAGKDRAWLHRTVASAAPDLIVLGPAYKLMTSGDPNKDVDVLKLFSALDEVRVKHDAALLIEAHTGHAVDGEGKRHVRPYGSSVWLRWPEIGIGLRRVDEDKTAWPRLLGVIHWRGMREERQHPPMIERGEAPELPWSPRTGEWVRELMAS
jgi:replicative DNA helicase